MRSMQPMIKGFLKISAYCRYAAERCCSPIRNKGAERESSLPWCDMGRLVLIFYKWELTHTVSDNVSISLLTRDNNKKQKLSISTQTQKNVTLKCIFVYKFVTLPCLCNIIYNHGGSVSLQRC